MTYQKLVFSFSLLCLLCNSNALADDTYYGINMGSTLDRSFLKTETPNVYCKVDQDKTFDQICVNINKNKQINRIVLYKAIKGYDFADKIYRKLSVKYNNISCKNVYNNRFKTQIGINCNTTNKQTYITLKVHSTKKNVSTSGMGMDNPYTMVVYEHLENNKF